ncbi:MAG: GIY-YIG nuclease family protein [Candidatus Peribacteraceae bacterium]|nr:GIY-YIG nuclease family protein [Candidatus Peribacteraceae bacterium]
MYIVYLIKNLVNNALYIGYTSKTLEERWKKHCWDSINRKTILALSIKKHGSEKFTIGVIETFDNEFNAKQKEIEMISLFETNRSRYHCSTGLNLTDGGEGTIGYVFTEEHKMNISKALTGLKRSEETKKRISEGAMGNIAGSFQTEETKKKKSELWKTDKNPLKGKFGKEHPSYGREISEDHKQKIKIGFKKYIKEFGGSMNGKKFTEEHKRKILESNPQKRSVDMFDKDEIYLRTFLSVNEAGRFINQTNGSNVSEVCRGKRKYAGGFIWKYTK